MIRTAFRDGLNSIQNFSSDDILSALGLERRRDRITGVMLPSVALFAAGALVGAAAAVLLTPKTGSALRRELTDGARELGQKLGTTANQATQAVSELIGTGNKGNANHSTTTSAT